MYVIVVKNEKELLDFAKEKGLKIITLENGNEIEKHVNVDNNQNTVNISQFLLSLGIKPHIKGFRYLKYIFEKNLDCSERITKVLYPTVATAFNTTTSKVERAIRHAIDTAVYDSNISELYTRLFGQFEYKPTNHQFLVGCKIYLEKH